MTHHTDRAAFAGRLVVDPQAARRINAIMMTCGHCDASGDFALRVGLPGKNGVGGGILAIAPRQASFAEWAPKLDSSGNSLVGALALERLSRRTGWAVFKAAANEAGRLAHETGATSAIVVRLADAGEDDGPTHREVRRLPFRVMCAGITLAKDAYQCVWGSGQRP